MSALDHVRQLAETIGPRGSTMPTEAAAAEYTVSELQRLGLCPVVQRFTSALSAWAPFSVLFGSVIVSGLLFLLTGRLGAVVGLGLSMLALLSALLEMQFRPNPLRWILPRGTSQNVWAKVDARVAAAQHAVLVAHLDTHRTPLVFSSDRWVSLFGRLVPIGLGGAALLILLLALGVAWPWPALRYASMVPLAVSLGILVLTVQADLTPYTAGANDNASGVGVVLGLAARLAAEPLSHVSISLLFTGCEEVGCYGADAFLRVHRNDVGTAAWMPVDTVGSADGRPVYLVSERFLLTTRSDPSLIRLADEISREHPDWEVRSIATAGTYTEGAVGAKHGLRVLSFGSQARSGGMSEWHRPTDTVDNVSEKTMKETERFIWEFLKALDLQATPGSRRQRAAIG